MSFNYKKPLIPFLHHCKNCGKRLSKHDNIVVDCIWLNSDVVYDWYCSKECARAFIDKERIEDEENDKLTDFILREEQE